MNKYSSALKSLQTTESESKKSAKTEQPNNRKEEDTKGRNLENSDPTLSGETLLEREKYSTYLESEIIIALKLYAVRHRLKHHQVVEAALKAYLKDK